MRRNGRGKYVLEGPKPLRDSSPMVARIKGVQTGISVVFSFLFPKPESEIEGAKEGGKREGAR